MCQELAELPAMLWATEASFLLLWCYVFLSDKCSWKFVYDHIKQLTDSENGNAGRYLCLNQ